MLMGLTLNVNRINILIFKRLSLASLRVIRLFATLATPPRCGHCGDSDGPLAAISDEPRQARKGATVVTDSGAGVWLSESPPFNRGWCAVSYTHLTLPTTPYE